MVTKTGNTHISGTMTDIGSVKIPMANPGFFTVVGLMKVSPNDCDYDIQPEMVSLMPKTAMLPFLVVSHCHSRLGKLSLSSPWSNSLGWKFDLDSHCSRDKNISGFGSHATLPFLVSVVVASTWDSFFDLTVVEN